MKFGLAMAIILTFTDIVKADEVLIVGGYRRVRQTEILDTYYIKTEEIDADLHVEYAVGFRTKLGPMVCGGNWEEGRATSLCHQFDPNSKTFKKKAFSLKSSRLYASAFQLTSDKALVFGGFDENSKHLDTMEIVNSNGSVLSDKRLPFTFSSGCSAKINNTHGIIIGGNQDGVPSSKTYFMNLNSLQTSPGPELQQERILFGCALSGTKVVVAGGSDGAIITPQKLDSTEILDLSKPNPAWTFGPNLPIKVYGLSLVNSANGILTIGGQVVDLKSIYGLSCFDGNDCKWTKVGELKNERSGFNAISINSTSIPFLQPILIMFSMILLLSNTY